MSAVVLCIGAVVLCIPLCAVVWGRSAVPKGLTACAKYRIDLKRNWKTVNCAVPVVGRTFLLRAWHASILQDASYERGASFCQITG